MGSKNQVKMNEFVNMGTKPAAFVPGERKVKYEVSPLLDDD